VVEQQVTKLRKHRLFNLLLLDVGQNLASLFGHRLTDCISISKGHLEVLLLVVNLAEAEVTRTKRTNQLEILRQTETQILGDCVSILHVQAVNFLQELFMDQAVVEVREVVGGEGEYFDVAETSPEAFHVAMQCLVVVIGERLLKDALLAHAGEWLILRLLLVLADLIITQTVNESEPVDSLLVVLREAKLLLQVAVSPHPCIRRWLRSRKWCLLDVHNHRLEAGFARFRLRSCKL